jgi:hypothetical protein
VPFDAAGEIAIQRLFGVFVDAQDADLHPATISEMMAAEQSSPFLLPKIHRRAFSLTDRGVYDSARPLEDSRPLAQLAPLSHRP